MKNGTTRKKYLANLKQPNIRLTKCLQARTSYCRPGKDSSAVMRSPCCSGPGRLPRRQKINWKRNEAVA